MSGATTSVRQRLTQAPCPDSDFKLATPKIPNEIGIAVRDRSGPVLKNMISSRYVNATRYDRDAHEVLDWHEHHNLSFCFVMSGCYEETTSRRTFICRPGDVVIKTAALKHLNRFGEQGALCFLLEIAEDFLRDSTGPLEPEPAGPVRDHTLARIGLELREELLLADGLSAFMLESIALRTLVSALRLAKRKSRQKEEVDAVRELLDAGAHVDNITRTYLTTENKVLRQTFQEIEGCSIKTYALRRRVFRAYDELVNTDYSLAEVAVRCGFYDQAHLTKVFGKLFGLTPGQFRSRRNRA